MNISESLAIWPVNLCIFEIPVDLIGKLEHMRIFLDWALFMSMDEQKEKTASGEQHRYRR